MSSATESIQVKSLEGGTVAIPADAFATFLQGHRGPVLQPSTAGYEEVRKIWNAMIDRKPAIIARASGAADVVHALRFARTHRTLVSVRGGGHNISGLSVCDGGLVIDLSLL